MQPALPVHSLTERVIGAAKLERPIYEEVKNDGGATNQAIGVVVVTGFLAGLGFYGGSNFWGANISFNGDDGDLSGFGSVVLIAANVVLSLIAWVFFSAVYKFVGTKLLSSPDSGITWVEVARPLAFASVPGVLGVLGFIPILGWLLSTVVFFWVIAAEIVAMSQTFQVSKLRAIAIFVVSTFLLFLVFLVPFCVCTALLL